MDPAQGWLNRQREGADHSTAHAMASVNAPGGGLRAAARWALLLSSLVAVGFVTWEYRHHSLPSPVPRTAPLHEFSEERARGILERLLALGPHELGSPALESVSQVMPLFHSQTLIFLTCATPACPLCCGSAQDLKSQFANHTLTHKRTHTLCAGFRCL